MPLLQTLATVQEEQSLGRLQELTSPVLSKVKEALIYTRLVNAQQRAFGSGTVVMDVPTMEGILSRQLHIGWFGDARLLVLAFKNVDMLRCPKGEHKHDSTCQVLPNAPLRHPDWLQAVAPEAEVHNIILKLFNHFSDNGQSLAEVMKSVTGGVTPRRVTCVGYCVGGALATLAALFSALQYPTADVRCITFGAQLTGNAAFANAFRWLVGTSYRVVYRRDPVPAMKQKRHLLSSGLTHVHGEIYITDDKLTPGKQPHADHRDIKDHSLMRYAEALHSICLAHFERDKAMGGDLYARFAACYLKLSGMDEIQQPMKLQRDMKEHEEGTQAQAAVLKDGAMQFKSSSVTTAPIASNNKIPDVMDTNDFRHIHGLVDAAFTNSAAGQEEFHAAGTAHPPGTAGTAAAAEATSAEASVDVFHMSNDMSKSAILQRGESHLRAFLDRAMLGPPLPESEAPTERGAMQTDSARSLYGITNQSSGKPGHVSNSKALQADRQVDSTTAAALEAVDLMVASANATDSAEQGRSFGSRSSSDMSTTTDYAHTLATADSDINTHRHLPQAADSPNSFHINDRASHISNDRSSSDSATSQQASTPHHDGSGAAGQPSSSLRGVPGGQQGGSRGRRSLKRAFSMMDQDNIEIDADQLNGLDKVLVAGKISQAVVIAAAAYRSEEEFQERTGITQSVLINDENHTNTHVHVGWLEGGTAVLAFRGTSTAQDGLQDVKIVRQSIDHLQEMFPGTQAHSGFLQQFAGVCSSDKPEKNMATVLQRLSGGKLPTRVLCCGHSLGGALATLGATWAALQYPQADIRCITFGSPRVGNKAFKRAFHTLVGTSLRLVHGADPVPVLPPAFVYHHVGGAIHILKNKIKLRHRSWLFKLRPNVADHLVARYNAGIYMHMPGGLEEMPLPRPRNIKRLSSLQPADVDGASTPMSSRSIFSVLNRLSPMSKMSSLSKHSSQGQDRLSSDFSAHRNGTDGTFRQSGDAAEGEWCYASSGGKGVAAASAATDGAGRALNAVTHTAAGLKNRAVQEAQDAAEVFGHRSEDSAKSKRRPFGRNSVGSDSSLPRANSGHWTLWHMFGCVTVQSNFRAESSSSDDDDDDDERVHVQAA